MSIPPQDARWAKQVAELHDLARRSTGKLEISEVSSQGLRFRLRCRSPIQKKNREFVVEECSHEIVAIRSRDWPAIPLVLIHVTPDGLVHPNISRSPVPGLICYGKTSPLVPITEIVRLLYDMLGYRGGRFNVQDPFSYNEEAIDWVNNVLSRNPNFFPTEREPLVKHEVSR